ncbi:MAG: hypothetical protein SGARI_007045, partial [Bacillariaceae sp.]
MPDGGLQLKAAIRFGMAIFLMIHNVSLTVCFVSPTPQAIKSSRHGNTIFPALYRHPPTKIETDFSGNSTSASSYVSKDANANNTERHMKFMSIALEQARKAAQRQEVPIGAIIVQRVVNSKSQKDSYKILSQAGNSMERKQDASAHAEILAMRQAAKKLGNWRLLNTTLYSTVEPCPMCLSAAQAFRIKEIVYGAPDLRLGAIETYMKMLDDYQHPIHVIDQV